MPEIDHIIVGARTVEEGAEYVERLLGARPGPGGAHPGVGTHNMLLGLGPDCYLEVIAPDPAQPDPQGPRPFGLDEPAVREALDAKPAFLTWVARTIGLAPLALRLGPQRITPPRAMTRGDLSWHLAFPAQNGTFDGLLPPLIEWEGKGAAGRLPDSGVRLLGLEGDHPEEGTLRAALEERGLEDLLPLRRSPTARLVARLRRADGGEAVLATV